MSKTKKKPDRLEWPKPDFSKLPTVHDDKAYQEAATKLEELRAELPTAEQEATEAAELFKRLNEGLELGEATLRQVDKAEKDAAVAERRVRGLRGAVVQAEKAATAAHAEAVAKIRGAWRERQHELARRYLMALFEIHCIERENTALESAFGRASGLGSAYQARRKGLRFPLHLPIPLPQTVPHLWLENVAQAGYRDLPTWPADPPKPKEERPKQRPPLSHPTAKEAARGIGVTWDGFGDGPPVREIGEL